MEMSLVHPNGLRRRCFLEFPILDRSLSRKVVSGCVPDAATGQAPRDGVHIAKRGRTVGCAVAARQKSHRGANPGFEIRRKCGYLEEGDSGRKEGGGGDRSDRRVAVGGGG